MASVLVELTNIINRWYDRWGKAIAAARVGQYAPARFATDVADTWLDAGLASALPLMGLGQVDVTIKPAIPVLQFLVPPTKPDATQFVQVQPPAGTTGAAASPLSAPGGSPTIPAANVNVVLSGTYIIVSLVNLSSVPASSTANVYSADLRATPSSTMIAQLQVVWPG
jgi:hypothetical protein